MIYSFLCNNLSPWDKHSTNSPFILANSPEPDEMSHTSWPSLFAKVTVYQNPE